MLDQLTRAIPKAGEARRLIHSYRSNRRSARERIADLILVLMYAGMLSGLVVGAAQVGFERTAGVDTPAPVAALVHWIVLLGTFLVAASLGKIALSVGPVLVRAPAQAWLLNSPIDRRALLAGRFAIVVSLGSAAGVLVALLATVAARGAADALPVPLAIGGALGAAFVSTTVLIQAGAAGVRRAQNILSVALGAGVVALVLVLIFRPATPLPMNVLVRGAYQAVLLLVALTAALIVVWLAQASLANLRRARLSAGADLAEAAAVATIFLEPTLLWGILLVRRTRRIARVRSVRFTGSRVAVLVMADFVRARRMWAGPVVWFGMLPVPYLAEATVAPSLLPAIHLVATYIATDRLAGGLRIVCRSPAIRRLLGGSDRQLIGAHLVLPILAAGLWCAATAAALPHMTVLVCAISAVGSVLVIYRISSRPPIEYSSPLVELGFGSGIPIWLFLQLSRGPALLLVLVWVQTSIAG